MKEHIQHNFNYEKRKTLNNLKTKNNERLLAEINNYETQLNSCLCSQNKLLSSIYDLDIPYHHRILKGSIFPDCPDPKLQYDNETNELIDDYEYLPDEIGAVNLSMEKQDKEYPIDIIQKFGKIKDINKIEEYVNKKYTIRNNDIYINCKPSSVLDLIHDGIIYLKNQS